MFPSKGQEWQLNNTQDVTFNPSAPLRSINLPMPVFSSDNKTLINDAPFRRGKLMLRASKHCGPANTHKSANAEGRLMLRAS